MKTGIITRQPRISVVDHKNERLFKCDGTLFDLLIASPVFEGGKLSVTRNNTILDQTESIQEVGTHCAITCFCGFKKMFARYYGCTNALMPEHFKTGDILTLDIIAPIGFNFLDSLKQDAAGMSALTQLLKEKATWSTEELARRRNQKMPGAMKKVSRATIIRFRAKPPRK